MHRFDTDGDGAPCDRGGSLNTNNKRRLLLHIGTGKTGSSALQVACVRNRGWLAERGVHYPAHASDAAAQRGEVVSGNGHGAHLYTIVSHALGSNDRPSADMFLDYMAGNDAPTVLLSSEAFWDFEPAEARFESLRDALAEMDVELHVAVFVRNVLGHALSLYSQVVKRHLYTGPFEQFIGAVPGNTMYYNPMRARLANLMEALGASNLHVMHYDSHRKDLVQEFLRTALNIHDTTGLDLSAGQVNRSLTPAEIDLMRRINLRLHSARDAAAVSNVLLEMPEFGARALTASRPELAYLSTEYASETTWINDRFFGGTDVLRVESANVTITDEPADNSPLDPKGQFLLNLIGALAPRVSL